MSIGNSRFTVNFYRAGAACADLAGRGAFLGAAPRPGVYASRGQPGLVVLVAEKIKKPSQNAYNEKIAKN